MRVFAAEYLGAAGEDCATKVLTRKVLNGEIDGIAEPNQRKQCGDEICPDDGLLRARPHRFVNGVQNTDSSQVFVELRTAQLKLVPHTPLSQGAHYPNEALSRITYRPLAAPD